jgi:hypothetical protein
VTVPIAAMHLNGLPAPSKHDVRLSGKVLRVQAKAKAQPVEHAAYDKLRRGVFRSYSPHERGAVCWAHPVDHRSFISHSKTEWQTKGRQLGGAVHAPWRHESEQITGSLAKKTEHRENRMAAETALLGNWSVSVESLRV